jgi:hypothetical protein
MPFGRQLFGDFKASSNQEKTAQVRFVKVRRTWVWQGTWRKWCCATCGTVPASRDRATERLQIHPSDQAKLSPTYAPHKLARFPFDSGKCLSLLACIRCGRHTQNRLFKLKQVCSRKPLSMNVRNKLASLPHPEGKMFLRSPCPPLARAAERRPL